ncbi:pro-sigmaK processing inhibitor BofA family protein [Caldisalinibacter kiritimatiensis]|uniref:Inhibitor of pro-sigmaK processing BofA n=1 Tax=Caldisalinibacter kiritimatiensis TaxID=1304284 RepID=R1CPI6_9FIRM|nr:pro-sigmaK processing inhibitor BofA family protein [Caldisalinibacter kiritimatiensis]EOD00576.1 Inhibitor of pro-sigmaK processing BofA [Caldisalinibacter kiritimatiensis]
MGLEVSVIVAYFVGILLLFIIGWLILIPLKFIFKLIINGIIGGVVLILLNFIGGFIGIHIGVNPITALIVGVLGVPGILLILIVQYII